MKRGFKLDGITTEIIIGYETGDWRFSLHHVIFSFRCIYLSKCEVILCRITEIDNWRVALEQTVAAVELELKKQDAAKEAVEQAIEAKVIDMDIVNEIMSIREQRRGNDYVMDEAQQELLKVTRFLAFFPIHNVTPAYLTLLLLIAGKLYR